MRVVLTLAVLLTSHVSLLTLRAGAQDLEDTLSQDSLAQDTVDYTARFLKAQEEVAVRVPVLPYPGISGPRPALTKVVFDRDSIQWGRAATVGDLLSQVPGVYLWRGGYIGRPEPVNFQARGASSAEYYLDGIPYVAAGVDSVAVDPALFSISFLDRIEVERWPGLLRVYLFTRRHDRRAPRSRIAIATGDRDFARYEAELERRASSGLGFALAADYLSSPTATVVSSRYSNTQAWLQGSYVPSARFGLQYQLLRSAPRRRAFVIADAIPNDTIGLGFRATRTDAQFRMSLRPRGEAPGPGLDVIYARTGWDGSGIAQQVNQIGGLISYRTPVFAAGGSAFHRTRWTPLDARGTVAWTPIRQFTASGEVVHQSHDNDRSSDYLSLAAGFQPFRGLSLTGSVRRGSQVAAPAIATDTAQHLRDYQATVGWERERLGLQVSWARTSAFSPFPYAEFLRVPSIGPAPEVNWLTVSARLAPLRWLTFEGWYSDPREGSPEGIPPTHSMVTATLRSKFLRAFPSGIFDLKLQVSMETWGRGIIGRDATGAPIPLRGATFINTQLQIQLQSFLLFWERGNVTASDLTYVPGFRIPSYGTTFGVRWEFLN
jgi:TonB-dependent Receptor Plug Domain